MLNRTDLLVKYQDLAILAASSVSDINDLVQLQKIVSAVPTFPNARSNSNNRVILVNEKHVQLLNNAIAFADANGTDVVYPKIEHSQLSSGNESVNFEENVELSERDIEYIVEAVIEGEDSVDIRNPVLTSPQSSPQSSPRYQPSVSPLNGLSVASAINNMVGNLTSSSSSFSFSSSSSLSSSSSTPFSSSRSSTYKPLTGIRGRPNELQQSASSPDTFMILSDALSSTAFVSNSNSNSNSNSHSNSYSNSNSDSNSNYNRSNYNQLKSPNSTNVGNKKNRSTSIPSSPVNMRLNPSNNNVYPVSKVSKSQQRLIDALNLNKALSERDFFNVGNDVNTKIDMACIQSINENQIISAQQLAEYRANMLKLKGVSVSIGIPELAGDMEFDSDDDIDDSEDVNNKTGLLLNATHVQKIRVALAAKAEKERMAAENLVAKLEKDKLVADSLLQERMDALAKYSPSLESKKSFENTYLPSLLVPALTRLYKAMTVSSKFPTGRPRPADANSKELLIAAIMLQMPK